MAVTREKIDRRLGRAAYDAVLSSQSWIHRKVESLHMLDGEVGRRRVSVDCTPPADAGLVLHRPAAIDPDGSRDQFLVPIAILSKVQIRNLDLEDAAGVRLSMAERSTFETVEVSAMVSKIEDEGHTVHDALLTALNEIARNKPALAKEQAEALLSGEVAFEGFDALALSEPLRRFIMDMAGGFLLIVVLDSSHLGRRSLLKYSSHWAQPDAQRKSGWSLRRSLSLFFRRCGWWPFVYSIDVTGAAFAASYHIEIHIPAGLAYDRMELPREERSSKRVDIDQGSIAHGGAHFTASPAEDARLILRTPSSQRLGSTFLLGLVTVIVLFVVTLPSIVAVLVENSASNQSIVSLLLLLPAGLIAFGNRTWENAIASYANAGLRGFSMLFALCYIVLAFTFSVFADSAQLGTLRLTVFLTGVIALLAFGILTVGYLRTRSRERFYLRHPDPEVVDDFDRIKPRAGRFGRWLGVEIPVVRVTTIEAGLSVFALPGKVVERRKDIHVS